MDPELAKLLTEVIEKAGLLRRGNGRVRFTERGFLLSNEVLCRFV